MIIVAAYCLDPFPTDDSRIKNQEVNSEKEAQEFLQLQYEKDSVNFWNAQILFIENGKIVKTVIPELKSKFVPKPIFHTTQKEYYDFILQHLPKVGQAQFSLNEQLNILMFVGNHLGLYDAVDLVQKKENKS